MDLYDYLPNSSLLLNEKYSRILTIFQSFEITVSEILSRNASELIFLTSIKVGPDSGKSFDESILENDESSIDISSDSDNERKEFLLIPELKIREVEAFQKLLAEEISNRIIYQKTCKVEKFSSGCPALDKLFGGGIPRGYVIEIAGESSTGKTQLLLQLSLFCQLNGSISNDQTSVNGKSVFISTEAQLPLRRLNELLSANFSNLDEKPSLDNIITMYISDWQKEAEFIIFHQLPELLENDRSIKLLLIDSISHHLRSNLLVDETDESQYDNQIFIITYLRRLYNFLESLAEKYNIAVVMANQVTSQAIPEKDLNDIYTSNVFDYDYQIGNMCGWNDFATKMDQFICYGEKGDHLTKNSDNSQDNNFCFTESDKIQIKRSLETMRKISHTSTPDKNSRLNSNDRSDKSETDYDEDDDIFSRIEFIRQENSRTFTSKLSTECSDYKLTEIINGSEAVMWNTEGHSIPVLSTCSKETSNIGCSSNNNAFTVSLIPEVPNVYQSNNESFSQSNTLPYIDNSMEMSSEEYRSLIKIQRIIPCLSMNSWWNSIPIRIYLSKSSNQFEIARRKAECKPHADLEDHTSSEVLFNESNITITKDLLTIESNTSKEQKDLINDIMSQLTIYECLKDRIDKLMTTENIHSWYELLERTTDNLKLLVDDLKSLKGYDQFLHNDKLLTAYNEGYDGLIDYADTKKHFFLKLINSPFGYSNIFKEVEILTKGYRCIL